MSGNLVQFLNQYEYEYVIKNTGKTIKFKPITTGQIKNLLTYEGSDKISVMEEMLDDLITGCVITEGFDINKLNIQDRFDLLIAIRMKSKGEVYQFVVKCPKCNFETINNVELDKLEVKPYDPEIDKWVQLSENLSVKMGYITRGDQAEAFRLVEAIDGTETQKTIELSMFIYAFAMKMFRTPAGDVTDSTLQDKKDLLENLGSDVYEKFQDWFKLSDYGTEFKYTLTCNKCDFKENRQIPVSDFFA